MRMRELINFLVVAIIILASLTYIHELGHAFFAKFFGCNAKSVIFDDYFVAYTAVSCKSNSDLIALGGIIFSALFSLLYLALGKEYFFLSLSISLLLALDDLSFFINPIFIILVAATNSFYSYFLLFDKVKQEKRENFL